MGKWASERTISPWKHSQPLKTSASQQVPQEALYRDSFPDCMAQRRQTQQWEEAQFPMFSSLLLGKLKADWEVGPEEPAPCRELCRHEWKEALSAPGWCCCLAAGFDAGWALQALHSGVKKKENKNEKSWESIRGGEAVRQQSVRVLGFMGQAAQHLESVISHLGDFVLLEIGIAGSLGRMSWELRTSSATLSVSKELPKRRAGGPARRTFLTSIRKEQ